MERAITRILLQENYHVYGCSRSNSLNHRNFEFIQSDLNNLDAFTNVLNQEKHYNLRIFSGYPGVVDTNMQKDIRRSNPDKFPLFQQVTDYYTKNELSSANYISQKIIKIIQNPDHFISNIVNIRDF